MHEMIRTATIDDAEAITALTRSAYAKWVPVIGREPLPMQADHAAALRDHRIDLLCVGAEIAALVEMIRCEDSLLIENVAVAPSFQKRGHGRTMIAHAVATTQADRWSGTRTWSRSSRRSRPDHTETPCKTIPLP